MPAITMPTVHMNGTSRAELFAQVERAYCAANDLRAALHAMSPNARDYYPQGVTAISTATGEHRRRLTKLGEITAELEALAEHLSA